MTDKKTATTGADGWTAQERAAMKEHAVELRRAGGKGAAKAAEEAQACLDKIAEMPEPDRVLAERIHAIVTTTAPGLTVKTWYGMPAYARDGKVVCFFKPADKFKVRYATWASATWRCWTTGACGPPSSRSRSWVPPRRRRSPRW
jgi:uncharacterized protein YdhG (YjbR/CyaY superfamily)